MRRLLPAVAVVLLASGARAQVPAGSEFLVNAYTDGWQSRPDVSMSTGRGFVVVWQGEYPGGDLHDVVGRSFDAFGAPIGGDFLIGTYTPWDQVYPRVDMGRNGEFVVTWVGDGIFARRYDAQGAPIGAEFLISPATSALPWDPIVRMRGDGGFVVAWCTNVGLGGLAARLFTAEGLPAGADVHVSSDGKTPALAVRADGSFVIIWSACDTSDCGLMGRRFDRHGVPQGAEFQVNSYTPFTQGRPSVAAASDGSFTVVWEDERRDGNGSGIFGRRFDAYGQPYGPDFAVNVYTTGSQSFPHVTMDADGDFLALWQGASDVHARRFDSAGTPVGGEFRVNSYTTGNQSYVRASSDANGNLVVVWTSDGQEGSIGSIFGQRFGGLEAAALDVDGAGNDVLEPGETVAVQPAWRNVSGATQLIGGRATRFTGPGRDAFYSLIDPIAEYGPVPNGEARGCDATGDCHAIAIDPLVPRPVQHWDAVLREDLVPAAFAISRSWLLHVGDTFFDVPRSSPFYRFVETLIHHGVTSGCGTAGGFCLSLATPREQAAVLLLRAREGRFYEPLPCSDPGTFSDVPASSPFCPWIEELARRRIVTGCAEGRFCPSDPVSREQIAVLVLATKEMAGYSPPACSSPMFTDVPPESPYCRWIEELARRGVVSGCGGGRYCPADPVPRGQVSVFLAAGFGLFLYGP